MSNDIGNLIDAIRAVNLSRKDRSAVLDAVRPFVASAEVRFQQYVADSPEQEMKELLHSTHEIALRRGADTHWEALAKSIAKLGIGPITARHYFAEGTPRETIDKHLGALLSQVNAARKAQEQPR